MVFHSVQKYSRVTTEKADFNREHLLKKLRTAMTEPIFVNRIRQELIDITMVTRRLANKLGNWTVKNSISLSNTHTFKLISEDIQLGEIQ